jgi:DNA-binding NtrC family response regulator
MNKINNLRIFIVDDDLFCRELYQKHLRNIGFENILVFENGQSCLDSLYLQPNVMFIDYNMTPYNGLELMEKVRVLNPDVHVLLISGQKDIRIALEALRGGAFDYIIKGERGLEMISNVTNRLMVKMVN